MTWQDPGGNSVPGGSPANGDASLEDTTAGWPPPPPQPGYPPAQGDPATAPGSVPPGMVWAPPAAYADPSALRFADVPARFVAWLLDNLLLGLVSSVIVWILFAAVAGSIDWRVFIETQTGVPTVGRAAIERFAVISMASTVVSAALNYVYFAFQWSSGARATLGMRVLRLQVGNAADGRTLGLGQATRRWLAMGTWLSIVSLIPVFGGLVGLVQLGWQLVLLVTTATSPTKQGLHDRIAETAIVTQGREDRVAAGCLLIIGIVILLALISIVALILLGSQISGILEEIGNSV